ncbi:MAG: cell division protein ZapA [Oscillospiraceae bacterium]|nr:cell division protein ZapA [Oscillospiraceae bacterium]
MDALNKVTIQIKGMKYHITTKEDAAYVVGLAHKIDESVHELTQGPKAVSLNEALVLVAMNYIDSYEKAEKQADSLRGQIAEYLEDAAKARLEASEARRELSKLERRLGGKG